MNFVRSKSILAYVLIELVCLLLAFIFLWEEEIRREGPGMFSQSFCQLGVLSLPFTTVTDVCKSTL